MNTLEVELTTYNAKLQGLLAHMGKFVVIRETEVLGTFDTYQDAATAGYKAYGIKPFLVKKIAPVEQVHFFSRDVGAPCRA